jgi:hypothetical protein
VRNRWCFSLAITAALGVPAAATAAAGVVYGGVTKESWPVMIQLSASGRQVVRAAIGLEMSCTSGDSYSERDGFTKLPVKKRRFGTSYGPSTQRYKDGTTVDYEGSIRGRLNKARTRISGTWQLTETFYDGSGKVTDTCRSGVSWTARQ